MAVRLDSGAPIALPLDNAAMPYLETLGIWFQLLRIADENVAMRERRRTETELGPATVTGSFAKAHAELGNGARTDTTGSGDCIYVIYLGPTLTAHSSEANRITVLAIHRRIYRDRIALDPRAGAELADDLRSEIGLL